VFDTNELDILFFYNENPLSSKNDSQRFIFSATKSHIFKYSSVC
jgi:hypothetical protein